MALSPVFVNQCIDTAQLLQVLGAHVNPDGFNVIACPSCKCQLIIWPNLDGGPWSFCRACGFAGDAVQLWSLRNQCSYENSIAQFRSQGLFVWLDDKKDPDFTQYLVGLQDMQERLEWLGFAHHAATNYSNLHRNRAAQAGIPDIPVDLGYGIAGDTLKCITHSSIRNKALWLPLFDRPGRLTAFYGVDGQKFQCIKVATKAQRPETTGIYGADRVLPASCHKLIVVGDIVVAAKIMSVWSRGMYGGMAGLCHDWPNVVGVPGNDFRKIPDYLLDRQEVLWYPIGSKPTKLLDQNVRTVPIWQNYTVAAVLRDVETLDSIMALSV